MYIKFILASTLLFLVSAFVPTESFFEGNISYSIDAENMNLPIFDQKGFLTNFGNKLEFSFKEGNYQKVFNGNGLNSPNHFYLKKTNRIYYETTQSDLLVWENSQVPNQKLKETKLRPKAETVLGVSCDELKATFVRKDGSEYSILYYFSPKYAINALWYYKHKIDNLDGVFAKMTGIPLKIVVEKDGYRTIFTATNVQQMDLSQYFADLELRVNNSNLEQK